jgi:hypothetical protein
MTHANTFFQVSSAPTAPSVVHSSRRLLTLRNQPRTDIARARLIGLAIGLLIHAPALLAQGTVSGVVRNELGQPVAEALVSIDPDSAGSALRTRTDAEGRFRIVNVRTGRHELQVVRLGFAPHYATIEVGTGETGLTIEMTRIPIQLDSIVVRAARTGLYGTVATRGWELLQHEPRPLRDVTVEILDTPYRARTSADGRFSVAELREGAYSLLVRVDRFASRIVPVYVPPEGGVDVTIVLDSMVADYQRRDDYLMRDISRRLREATNPSAMVPLHELAGPPGQSLRDALRAAPSAITRGLVLRDDVTCVYVNAEPRPRMIADDILAEEVQSVEVYGAFARGGTMAPPSPWRIGEFCGTGMNAGPIGASKEVSYNVARVIVVWLKRRR